MIPCAGASGRAQGRGRPRARPAASRVTPAIACGSGSTPRNDANFTPADYEIIRRAGIETLKTMSRTRAEVYARLRYEHPQLEFIVRLHDDRIGGSKGEHRGWHPSAAEFLERFVPRLADLKPYATKFEVHNEPNHEEFYEGWGPGLDAAANFNRWFQDVYHGLKRAHPWAEIGFPGLALHAGGFRADLQWAKACSEAINLADWLGVHCYWQHGNLFSEDWGLYFTAYHRLFPNKPIEITEFADSTPGIDPHTLAQRYATYYTVLHRHGLFVRSASAFIATSPDPTWAPFSWGKPQGGFNPVVDVTRQVNRPLVVPETPIDQLPEIVERRFLLPARPNMEPYGTRDIKDIAFIVIHQSDNPTASAESVAQWAVTQTDGGGRPFYPEIPYHFFIEPTGTIKRCHSLDVLTWHAGAVGQPSPGGVGLNNWQGVAICLAGAFSGAKRPTDAQLRSAGKLCHAIRKVVTAELPVLGHRETPGSATACPGDNFLGEAGWKQLILRLAVDPEAELLPAPPAIEAQEPASPSRPEDPGPRRASASHHGEDAELALDGDPRTVWSSGAAQVPEMWMEIDLGSVQAIRQVALQGPEQEFPRGLLVVVSADRRSWQVVARRERLIRAPVTVRFPAVQARYIGLEQTSSYVRDNRYDLPWSINEVLIA